jgi:hypothetical protein
MSAENIISLSVLISYDGGMTLTNRRFHRREPENRELIYLDEQWQITYWTQELLTTQDRLNHAIRSAGNNTDAVREWLEKNPPPRKPVIFR